MTEELDEARKRLKEQEEKINKQIESYDKRIYRFNIIGWIAIIGGLALIIPIFQNTTNSQTVLKLSEIGDYLGGTVASLWSLSGLFFIYVAFLGQQKQMLLQNLELQYSRLELKETRAEFREQTFTNKLQRFENTFFSMINAFKDDVKNISVSDIQHHYRDKTALSKRGIKYGFIKEKNITYQEVVITEKGKSCFELFYYDLQKHLLNSNLETKTRKEVIAIAYPLLLKEHNTILEQYNKSFIHISEFIHHAKIEDKQFYFDYLRAQLSTYEMLYIYYACISATQEEGLNYYQILKEYNFLRRISSKPLLLNEDKLFYAQYFKPTLND
jgi:hypothetical protein